VCGDSEALRNQESEGGRCRRRMRGKREFGRERVRIFGGKGDFSFTNISVGHRLGNKKRNLQGRGRSSFPTNFIFFYPIGIGNL
jgi:hypothetical protein